MCVALCFNMSNAERHFPGHFDISKSTWFVMDFLECRRFCKFSMVLNVVTVLPHHCASNALMRKTWVDWLSVLFSHWPWRGRLSTGKTAIFKFTHTLTHNIPYVCMSNISTESHSWGLVTEVLTNIQRKHSWGWKKQCKNIVETFKDTSYTWG